MGKTVKRLLAVVLAVVLLVSGSTMLYRADGNKDGQAQQTKTAAAQVGGSSPLKVEITSNKDRITLLGTVEFTATITNISNQTVKNISVQVLLGEALRPLQNSQLKTTNVTLAPNANIQLKYSVDIGGLKGLDFLLYPLLWVASIVHGVGGFDTEGNFNDGRAYIEESKTTGLVSLFSSSYDTSTTVKAWYGQLMETNDFGPDKIYEYAENDISYDAESDTTYINNIVIMSFDWDTTDHQKWNVVKSINGTVVGQISGFNELHVRVSKRSKKELKDLCQNLRAANKDVGLYVHIETLYDLEDDDSRPLVDSKAFYDPYNWAGGEPIDSWDEANPLGVNWHLTAIQAPSAWKYDNFFSRIKIGVYDNAFDITHEDLDIKLPNAENSKKNVIDGKMKIPEHGTHVAGIIGAKFNGIGVNGIIRQADLYGYVKEKEDRGQVTGTAMGKGLEVLVTSGCRVINFSQGYCQDWLKYSTSSIPYEKANETAEVVSARIARLLENKKEKYDFVVVQSAGNGATDITSTYPKLGVDAVSNGAFCSITIENCYSDSKTVSKQDILNRIIVVTSAYYSNSKFIMAPDANGGPQVDIAAPGVWIYSTAPTSVFPWGYSEGSGTSMAAPIVSGVAGLVWSINPNFTGAKVKEIICNSYDRNVWVADNPASPNAVPMDKNGSINLNGYRMVNAKLAVEEALRQSGINPEDIPIVVPIDPPTDGVTGNVKDASNGNILLAGVTVTAFNIGTINIAATTTTNANGEYFLQLPSGSYDLVYAKTGYVIEKRQVIAVAGQLIERETVLLQRDSTGGTFAGGNGSAQSPYLVSTPVQLDAVRNDLTAHYKMINDIDLIGRGNWTPIGTNSTKPFTGEFDGNGCVIKNMNINFQNSTLAYVGLFGYVSGATLKNTGIIDSKVNMAPSNYISQPYAGGIVGYSVSSAISNCYSTSEVNASASSGIAYAGGVVGYADSSTIISCYNTGEVNASTSSFYAYAGGIAGGSSTIISTCYNTGKVFATSAGGDSCAGGIVGLNSSTINDCYNKGNIGTRTSAQNSYASGYAGGIAGRNNSQISSCYNTGEVNVVAGDYGNIYEGGIAGNNNYLAVINNCYYLNNIENATGTGSGTLANVKILTATQMKQQSSFVGFDFTNTWAINPAINNGYPYLRGMQP